MPKRLSIYSKFLLFFGISITFLLRPVFAFQLPSSFIPAFWQVFNYQFLTASNQDSQYLFYILQKAQKGKVVQNQNKFIYQFYEGKERRTLILEAFIVEESNPQRQRYLFQFECFGCKKPFFFQIEAEKENRNLIWNFSESKTVFLKETQKETVFVYKTLPQISQIKQPEINVSYSKKLEENLFKKLLAKLNLFNISSIPEDQKEPFFQTQKSKLLPLLITEVCVGFENSQEEFIEIFNPNEQEIDLTNIELVFVNSKGERTKKKITWKRKIIPPKGFFLFTSKELAEKIEADAVFSSQLTSSGGVILKKEDQEIDKIAWGRKPPEIAEETKGVYLEKGLKTGQSLQRKGKNNIFQETNNNQKDFFLQLNPNPQNSQNKIFFLPETKQNQSKNQQIINQKEQNFIVKLLIVEVQIEGENAYQDYIKIYNPNPFSVDLSSWQIKKRNKNGKESSIIKFKKGSKIDPFDFLVWASSKKNFHQELGTPYFTKAYLTKDNSIALFDANKNIVDALAWGQGLNQFKEGEPFPYNPSSETILQRRQNPEGFFIDTDNNKNDFILK